jgi:hypothetical protein
LSILSQEYNVVVSSALALGNLHSSILEGFHFLSRAFFAKKFRLLVVCPVIISGFEKSIAASMFTAREARSLLLHFPECCYFCSENIFVHPEKNARPNKVSNDCCNEKIDIRVGTENPIAVYQNGSQNWRGKLPPKTIKYEFFEHRG